MTIFVCILALLGYWGVWCFFAYRQRHFSELEENYNTLTLSYQMLKKDRDALALQALEDTRLLKNQLQAVVDGQESWRKTETQRIREDTLAKQKQVRIGYTSEHFAPFSIPQWQAEDFFRVGGSIDYLVLCGADAVRDKRANLVDKVVLLDIKTGDADLNTVQRRIRDAIVAGRVEFATYNMTTQELRTWEMRSQTTTSTSAVKTALPRAQDGRKKMALEKPLDSSCFQVEPTELTKEKPSGN